MSDSVRDQEALAQVERLLYDRIGLDASTVGVSLIHRAVSRRIVARGVDSSVAYARLLSHEGHELEELVEQVVIPETYFFREPEALIAIAARARAMAGVLSAAPPLRILSAPCSTGEEPYSIAMTLLDAGVAREAIAIDAVDVSRDAVRRAKAGVYRTSAFRSTAPEWLRFFDREVDDLHLHTAVKSLVRFEQANLLASTFIAPSERYDVIFCRNLLIYFDTATQARVLATLGALLAPGGVLVVGAADTFAVRRAAFTPVAGAERSFLFERSPVADGSVNDPALIRRTRARPARGAAGSPKRPVVPSKTPKATPNVARTLKVNRAARAGSGAARAEVPRTRPPVAPAPTHDTVAGLANAGRLQEALRAGEEALASHVADATLHALVGTVHSALGNEAQAERCFRRAVYLDPSQPDALAHLALLAERRGDIQGAHRLRLRAARGVASASEITT